VFRFSEYCLLFSVLCHYSSHIPPPYPNLPFTVPIHTHAHTHKHTPLSPSRRDMEYKLRPGMIMLTWTSMNIDAYKSHIHAGLRKLEELVVNINDIIENRIEKNLKMVRLYDT
jgi:hypothetical protein